MSLVRFDSVGKSFAGDPVLENVDLRIEEGEKIALIGRNGAGKSTVFRLITGEITPDTGTIERMRRARLAHLAQMPRLTPSDTVMEVVLHSFRELIEMEERLRELEHRLG